MITVKDDFIILDHANVGEIKKVNNEYALYCNVLLTFTQLKQVMELVERKDLPSTIVVS